MPGTALCMNAGSSSLKAALFALEGDAPRELLSATLDPSSGEQRLVVTEAGRSRPLAGPEPRSAAVGRLLDLARARAGGALAVGHRVVHGDAEEGPLRLDRGCIDALRRLAPLAPLHQDPALDLAEEVLRLDPELPQFASLDSSFHTTMPGSARRLPLPEAATHGLERYGFHGLSYRSVARRMRERARHVVALHLGGGASACAMRDGRSLDTTMGATPLAGPMMTTRSGSLDPGVILFLMRHRGWTVGEVEDLLWRRSGLLGVSGLSNDLRDLEGLDNPDARAAVELFCADLRRHAGAMAASLGGMDALVFTGGAGVDQPAVRAAVAEGFARSGLTLDEGANRAATAGTVPAGGVAISAPGSRISAWVLPLAEEAEIARDVQSFTEETA
ncbi:acetate/propionate family kinase [Oceanicella sp. SM1341]|uniref:acetate/propionate family kinase n=1 Tax=Oceanicella sp. SM1341 TaxID=1548889 RepID=UPI0013005BC7|nr:acetate kinase [Oceanicella sp. SM1341]